jgi:hypothetical protein
MRLQALLKFIRRFSMKVRTFSDVPNTEYADQTLYIPSKDHAVNTSGLLNDIMDGYEYGNLTPVYGTLGSMVTGTMDSGDCGCEQTSTPRKRLSPEYKMLWVVIGIVVAWIFVTWHHHSQVHHMRTLHRS